MIWIAIAALWAAFATMLVYMMWSAAPSDEAMRCHHAPCWCGDCSD